MFWLWIGLVILAVVGLSVVIGKSLNKPPGVRGDSSRHAQVTALKASGALRHRKSNRE